MKTYHGTQTEHGAAVVVEDNGEFRALDPRLDLKNLSEGGFSWGFTGPGPAQLALALAADVLGNDTKALSIYMRLKYKLIGTLPDDGWVLAEERILAVIDAIEREQARALR